MEIAKCIYCDGDLPFDAKCRNHGCATVRGTIPAPPKDPPQAVDVDVCDEGLVICPACDEVLNTEMNFCPSCGSSRSDETEPSNDLDDDPYQAVMLPGLGLNPSPGTPVVPLQSGIRMTTRYEIIRGVDRDAPAIERPFKPRSSK